MSASEPRMDRLKGTVSGLIMPSHLPLLMAGILIMNVHPEDGRFSALSYHARKVLIMDQNSLKQELFV